MTTEDRPYTIISAFLDMLERIGLQPTGSAWERQQKERKLMNDLGAVRDFPIDKLHLIEKWATEERETRFATRTRSSARCPHD